MDCLEMSQWMSLSLDGILTEDQASRLRVHLAECLDCQVEWAAMQRVSRLLVNAPLVVPPSGFTAKVRQCLARREARRRKLLGGMVLLMGSLSLGSLILPLVVGGLLLLWQLGAYPPLLNHLLHSALQLMSFVKPLLRACWLMVRALFPTPGLLILFVYTFCLFALIVLWSRLVARAWPRGQRLAG